MSTRTRLLLASGTLAISMAITGTAFAGDFNGLVEGDWSNVSGSGGNSGTANLYGGSGSIETPLDVINLNAQVDLGYHDASVEHENIGNFNADGDLFWQGERGRLGATVGYQTFNCCGVDLNATNYGAFAELYAMPTMTVGVKGGAFSGNYGIRGSYGGGEVLDYLTPDCAVSGTLDYTSFDHTSANELDYGIQGEWLFSEQTPISGTIGYTRSNISHGGGNYNVFMLGVKLYLNGNGATTLVDRQRTGNETWGSKLSSVATLQF